MAGNRASRIRGVTSRYFYYPIAIGLAIFVIVASRDASHLNRVASAALNLEKSSTLAWKSVLETLSFSLYSGASDVKAGVDSLVVEANRRERRALQASFAFTALSVAFLLGRSWNGRNDPRHAEAAIGDQLAIAVICLGVGLLAPILSLKAYANAPIVGQVILKYEVKSVLSAVTSLVKSHNYIVAILLATFSVITPLLKLLTAVAMLQQRLPRWHSRGVVFIKSIGKWSMADVFVVAVFVAYFAASGDEFSEARIGLGLYYFATYCLLSQYATHRLVTAAEAGPQQIDAEIQRRARDVE